MNSRRDRLRKTATDFEMWLRDNPNVTKKKKIRMFNTIADANYSVSSSRLTKARDIKRGSSSRIKY